MTQAPNSLSYQCSVPRDERETMRKSDALWKSALFAKPVVIPEAIDLVHALMQNGHDPDVAVREMAPVNQMVLVAEEEPLDTELGRDGFRHDTVRGDLVECRKQTGDVFLGLIFAPPVAGVAVDVIKAVGRPFLDPNGGHRISPGSARPPRLRSAADRSRPGLRRHGSVRPSAG